MGNITSGCLWSIFKPGEPVVLRRQVPGGRFETFCGILQSARQSRRPNGTPVWSTTIRHMDFKGDRIGVVEENYEFLLFAGQQPITSLPIYPLSYSSARVAVTTELEARGRTFISLCRSTMEKGGSGHMGYSGPVWVQRKKYEVDGCDFFDAPERTASPLLRERD